MSHRERALVVITGGPGAGKTTLIDTLAARGFPVVEEAGRRIIREEVAASGTALPWADRSLFAEKMFASDVASYEAAATGGLRFFDRGIPDVIGYLRLIGQPVPPHMTEAARTMRYRHQVFIAPPWEDIFTGDEERKQSFEEAVQTCEVLAATYRAFGYELIELPLSAPEARGAFVLERCSA